MQTYEGNTIDASNSDKLKARLDRNCKKILASRYITAYILKSVVPEYRDCDINKVMKLIGKREISKTTVDMDIPPIVQNESAEDNSINEGQRFYDIKFTARTPQDQTIALIINIEIQNEIKKYHLIKRAEYYCARLISAQYNSVFTGSDFDKIQKVYSIWICTSPDAKHRNTISLYKMNRENLIGNYTDSEEDKRYYDLMNIIMVYLGDSQTKECGGIIRMLYSLLVANLSPYEKKKIAHEEFGVPIVQEFDKEVDDMCDISTLYISQGVAQGIAQGIAQGMAQGMAQGVAKGALEEKIKTIIKLFKKGMPVADIADTVELTISETEKIIKENL